ncbi:hypothetical protein LG198_07905 [Methylobacillus arboreus]|uniref:hypothetical protein n=1 Tax=Methylobacillus arboreus TaxID=755170 RepID=UPI001E644053|nr:hypothetical protein [Methylobacillus arboreus]MCB5190646.1 hypothetical protein [Methylobacillus arboreus]
MQLDNEQEDSGIFWPGYVDAVSNLVLNLLFVVVILTIAVFIFAMELGRRHISAETPVAAPTEEQQHVSQITPSDMEAVEPTSYQSDDDAAARLRLQVDALQKQLAALKGKDEEARRLKDELAALQHEKSAGRNSPRRVVSATIRAEEPDMTIAGSQGGLVVDFVDDAITISTNEADELRGPLQAIVDSGGATLEVTVPPGFTEARRLAFYRAMAVRNLLIEMNLPADRINVSVVDGNARSDSSLVSVMPASSKP